VVSNKLCHSWDIGTTHFIIFSTELYFFLEDGLKLAEYQYNWLENNLKVVLANLAIIVSEIFVIVGFTGCSIQERQSMDYHSWASTNVLFYYGW